MDPNTIAQKIFNDFNLDDFRRNGSINAIQKIINVINNIINHPEIGPEIAARLDAWRGLLEITLDERQRARYNYSRYAAAAAAGGRRKNRSRRQRRSRKNQ